ncbi:TRAP transporter small permease subunit [Roseobacter sp. HKCCD9010]|uniref:TRAP transporter small permease n=1 Tax=unclassified Roseobacter TaxID=196798 RepID=UPI0014917D44|nr:MULTISPECIES: TRAP transporter small permease [unclassified Roseobacter]MBF9052558.1 TRAP transporter small permease subunit [Rhodobacterales bacterium HKCCD4356]NNV14026.1 TRAP transporter small permease subunit [Roseobacter sp. HKCCD7357]NNV18300.1 TRAP transporter small permease subunit [Roseobacter sp. HKCCD8768]NNV27725.1 TRAP transporter small permease subunit [Roseobacter sp. HKCCD8192]NNV32000.1 TRAP transporter small permease subunit [Roseobacter sp. HKCCD9061]
MFILRWLEKHFEEALCCIALSVIAVAVISQVVARYVFEVALHWTEEAAAICMVWAVYMGASLCVRERFHIRILIAVQAFPVKIGRFAIFTADLAWAAFSILMVLVSWQYLTVLWRFPSRSPSLGINEFYPQTILVIGYGLMLIRLIQTYVLWYRDGAEGLPGMLVEDGDATPDEEHLF